MSGLLARVGPEIIIPRLAQRAREEQEKRKRMVAQKEDAEGDLLAFVRMMWPVLEPMVPLIEGWVLDLLCLPAEAVIITEEGPRKIGEYVETRCADRVLSFNHATGRAEWRAVLGTMARPGSQLITLRTRTSVLSATGNHPVFARGRGYVRADEIKIGDEILRVPQLWGQLPETGEWEKPVLRPGLCWCCSEKASELDLPEVRRTQSVGRQPVSGVRLSGKEKWFSRLVRGVRGVSLADSFQAAAVLLSGVFFPPQSRAEPCVIHDRGVGQKVSTRILAREAECSAQRRRGLSAMRRWGWASCPPCGPGQAQQRNVELGDPLPNVPREAAPHGRGCTCIGYEAVCAVERNSRLPDTVYSIQVEGNANHFVDGILVHNCDVLMGITFREIRPPRVCINVPPGSTKSTLLNVLWPAWEWGPMNMPSMRYLSASYSTGVPIRDNLRFGTIVSHPVYQQCWGDRVKIKARGAEIVSNDRTGWKIVTSVEGGTTGWRGDRLLLDDLNNPQSVESDLVRRTTNRFVREIMPDRLNDLTNSAIINLQQRTHQNDATGTLLEHGQGYTFVCVPMRFDPLRIFPVVLRRDADNCPVDVWEDPRSLDGNGERLAGLTTNSRGEPAVEPGSPIDRAEGTSCWPERFDEDALIALEKEKGPYAWSSQYQQYPGVRGGSIIRREWWRLWKEEDFPPLGTVLVSVDTAVETKETNDYTAVTKWGAFEGRSGEPLLILLDAWRDRLPLAEMVRRVYATCMGWSETPGTSAAKADYLLLEDKTQGRAVHDELLRLNMRNPWQSEMIKPRGDKIARLTAVSHLFSGDAKRIPDGKDEHGKDKFRDVYLGGIVYAPNKSWTDDVITEVADFPYSAHDDWTDTVSQALNWVRRNGVVLRKEEWDEVEYQRNLYRKPLTVPYSIKRT